MVKYAHLAIRRLLRHHIRTKSIENLLLHP